MVKFKITATLAILLVLSISFIACNNNKKLPIYGEREAKITKDVNGKEVVDTIYQTIPAFGFLNQDSVIITQDTFKDKIYIADFFFTSCSTICPVMHRNLKMVYDEYKDNPTVMFLSHTIDFKYDKPSVLKKYAHKLGVDDKKWQFVYGPKESIYHLAEQSYLTVVGEDSTARDGYIHQGWLVLVDKGKKIRGTYDGTNTEQVAQLKKDVAILLKEQ
ncbi:MAG TPA: SCO family protein [Pedobacter sp.]|nr:SCO family protein [Pedobacter sp.]